MNRLYQVLICCLIAGALSAQTPFPRLVLDSLNSRSLYLGGNQFYTAKGAEGNSYTPVDTLHEQRRIYEEGFLNARISYRYAADSVWRYQEGYDFLNQFRPLRQSFTLYEDELPQYRFSHEISNNNVRLGFSEPDYQ